MKIKDYLEKYGVTLQQMADELGVTAPAVFYYRNGRVPSPEIARKIVKMTNGEVSYADLYESAETN
jgi:transcriptional regulator with XRE-family HTH domain